MLGLLRAYSLPSGSWASKAATGATAAALALTAVWAVATMRRWSWRSLDDAAVPVAIALVLGVLALRRVAERQASVQLTPGGILRTSARSTRFLPWADVVQMRQASEGVLSVRGSRYSAALHLPISALDDESLNAVLARVSEEASTRVERTMNDTPVMFDARFHTFVPVLANLAAALLGAITFGPLFVLWGANALLAVFLVRRRIRRLRLADGALEITTADVIERVPLRTMRSTSIVLTPDGDPALLIETSSGSGLLTDLGWRLVAIQGALTVALRRQAESAPGPQALFALQPTPSASRQHQALMAVAVTGLLSIALFTGLALRSAVWWGWDGAVQALLDLRVPVDVTNAWGDTALHAAALHGRPESAGALVADGASVDLPRRDRNQTALHVAVEEDHCDVARALLEGGANVDARTDAGETALWLVGAPGRPNRMLCAEALLAAGAAIDAADVRGMTPLHHAAEQGDARVVAWLVEHGAQRHRLTVEGRESALQIAQRRKRTEVVRVLTEVDGTR